MKNLYLLLTVIKRSDAEEYEEFYRSNNVSVIYNTPCNGTTHEKNLSILGIEKTDKALLISPIIGSVLKDIIHLLTVKMKIDLPDRGVAMAVPMSGIAGARTLAYFTGLHPEEISIPTADAQANNDTEKKTEEKEMLSAHELIIAIYEKGYTDLVMDAAREAGARGGTTIRAKGTGAGAEKFFGLSLAEEKEIVLIVSGTEQKKDIMKAIMQKAGVDSKAHALVFSLPVSDTAGFRFADTIEKD